jgi:hypothetical protein
MSGRTKPDFEDRADREVLRIAQMGASRFDDMLTREPSQTKKNDRLVTDATFGYTDRVIQDLESGAEVITNNDVEGGHASRLAKRLSLGCSARFPRASQIAVAARHIPIAWIV